MTDHHALTDQFLVANLFVEIVADLTDDGRIEVEVRRTNAVTGQTSKQTTIHDLPPLPTDLCDRCLHPRETHEEHEAHDGRCFGATMRPDGECRCTEFAEEEAS